MPLPLGSVNPLRRLDSWLNRHPHLVDTVVTVLLILLLGAGGLMAVSGYPGPDHPDYVREQILMALLSVAQLAPWAIRRWKPVLSATLVAAAALVQLLWGPEFLASLVAVPMTVHNLAYRGPRWASIAGICTALAGGVANGVKVWLWPRPWLAPDGTTMTGTPGDFTAFVVMTVMCAAVSLAAWAFGDLARTRRIALQQLEDRARQLEVEAAQERELAAADERNHIAREMHDIVAHSLQVIIAQADGGRYAGAADPKVAVQTLETISGTGRQALGEMRRLLGVLRGPEAAELRPQPSLADVAELVDGIRLTGLDVEHTVEGEPRRSLPAGSELAAYRAIQESLTNTVRHGGPRARAWVTQRWTPSGLEIEVLDDGRGAAASQETQGSQQGLIGLQERIAIFGGTVQAGPRQGGGFRVFATLPYQEV